MALLLLRRYEEVIQAFTRKSSLASWDHAYLAVAYAHLGRDEDARKEAALAVPSARSRRACGPSLLFLAQQRTPTASKSARSGTAMANLLRSPP